jgi:hypothetical protein
MTQADSTPTAVRDLFTGARPDPSTNPTGAAVSTLLPAGGENSADRRYFIGGSDARIIMGNDEAALLHLWQEKRGEAEPADLRATSSSSSELRPRS